MVVLELYGSGGCISADITDEQAKKADLGVGKCFLAPVGKLREEDMHKYFCKKCETEFTVSPKIQVEESPNEAVADGLILVEGSVYVQQMQFNNWRIPSI